MKSALFAMLQEVPFVEPPRFVGVYFLFDGDEIVYVGQSTDVPKRILAHQSRRQHPVARWRTKWDRSLWMPVPEKDLDAYEGALIRSFTPRFNTSAPSNDARDDEICRALNLPPRDLARYAEYLGRRHKSFVVPGAKRSEWNRERKKRTKRLQKLGVVHIKNPWALGRKIAAVQLWRSVLPFIEAEAAS